MGTISLSSSLCYLLTAVGGREGDAQDTLSFLPVNLASKRGRECVRASSFPLAWRPEPSDSEVGRDPYISFFLTHFDYVIILDFRSSQWCEEKRDVRDPLPFLTYPPNGGPLAWPTGQ